MAVVSEAAWIVKANRIVLVCLLVQLLTCGTGFRHCADRRRQSCRVSALSASKSDHDDVRPGGGFQKPSVCSSFDRRSFIACASTSTLVTHQASIATDSQANLDCLLDLPPVPRGGARIFLCRHGQTENNRLHRVQGARVNPRLNKNGEEMATRLGLAFSRLDPKSCPQVVAHSNLLRASQTAAIASKQLKHAPRLKTLHPLGEVDFGPSLEGKKISFARAEMVRTYSAWSAGLVDEKPEGGGESAREVLGRVASALSALSDLAFDNGGTVAAVSHSTYLRIVLAVLLDIPLAQASTLKLANGCINVLHVRRGVSLKTLGPKSILFGGPISQAPNDFELNFPTTDIIRINEIRHLNGLM